MKIAVSSLLQEAGLSEEIRLDKSEGLMIEDFASYHFPEPLSFEGELVSEQGRILRLRGSIKIVWEAACDLCLRKVRREEEIPVDEQIFPPGYVENSVRHLHYGGELYEEEEEECLDPEELPEHDGRFFSPDKLFEDLVLLYLPIGVKCSEDCPGLCPHCGRRRDDPACHCEEKQKKAPGPFDKLAELL